MIQISNIKVGLDEDKDLVIIETIKSLLGEESDYDIVKESVDARKIIVFVYTVNVHTDQRNIRENKKIQFKYIEYLQEEPLKKGDIKLKNRPVIVGFGPAGIFAALELAQNGYKPVVYERGRDVDQRALDVEKFWETGELNPESNVQFGEGGAGTFSDGKLTTRIKDPRARSILEHLVKHGAPEEILYSSKPHVGTDILREVVKSIREEIINLGGEIHFNEKLNDIETCDEKITKIKINDEWIDVEVVIMAIGHSSRDTYKMLNARNVDMLKKAFAVGFRIEHPQLVIDKAQFKENYDHPKLKSAEYHLTHTSKNNRACYTFCMCPGGMVIGSASDHNQVVVNGMSYHARSLENANSAILCSITPDDLPEHTISGIEFQEEIEHKAFLMGGSDYKAPVQLVGDFLAQKLSTELGSVSPTYKPGVRLARLDRIYPKFVYDAISEAIKAMGRRLKGFDMHDAVLTGVETRTSSPVRTTRGEDMESTNLKGLYPCGEGAGYAGGIVSAAVDGLKSATFLMNKYYL